MSHPGLLRAGEKRAAGEGPAEATKMVWGLEHLLQEESDWSWASLVWRSLRGHLISVCKYLQGKCQEDGSRLYLVAPSDTMRKNGRKLKHKMFHLNVRKSFFSWRLEEPWNSCSGRLWSLCRCSKRTLDTAAGDPAWQGGGTGGSLPARRIL